MRSLVLLSLVLAFSSLMLVQAWGPITHYKFACDFVAANPNPWITTVDPNSLYTASDLPDGQSTPRLVA